MARLLSGRATDTDGRLTKNNPHREAGVSRATMNRATAILNKWNAAVDCPQPRDNEITKLDDAIKELRATAPKLRAEVRDLEAKVAAATTMISSLHQEKQALRGTEVAVNVQSLKRGRDRHHARR